MNINRHNYEEFFLLYADNELSGAEKKEVMVFIEQNPDLQREFLLLQQTILKSEAISFDDKISLVKEEINIEAQNSLLLLLDNEISDDEKENIFQLIAADASLGKEWSLLQQTKLQPDITISFDDKGSLYRESRERVIGFGWMRVAVAAIFIGFGIWFTFPFLIKKNKAPDNTIASANSAKPNNVTAISKHSEDQSNTKLSLKDTDVIKTQQQTFAAQTAEKRNRKINVQTGLQQNNTNSVLKNDDETPGTNNLPNLNVDFNSNKNIASNVPLKKLNEEIVNQQKDMAVNKQDEKLNNNSTPTNIYASNASLKDNEDGTNDDNHILYIPESKLQKTKIGGLFSKVKKAIKNTAKSGIRIANIEIAIK